MKSARLVSPELAFEVTQPLTSKLPPSSGWTWRSGPLPNLVSADSFNMLSMCFLQDATAVSPGSFSGAAAAGIGSFGCFADFFVDFLATGPLAAFADAAFSAAVAEESDKKNKAPTRQATKRMN